MCNQKILKKIRSAFGDEKSNICKNKNISSCWTDFNRDENTGLMDTILKRRYMWK